jgi:hypothetical protein
MFAQRIAQRAVPRVGRLVSAPRARYSTKFGENEWVKARDHAEEHAAGTTGESWGWMEQSTRE